MSYTNHHKLSTTYFELVQATNNIKGFLVTARTTRIPGLGTRKPRKNNEKAGFQFLINQ